MDREHPFWTVPIAFRLSRANDDKVAEACLVVRAVPGTISISGIAARAGSLAIATIVSAISSGCKACFNISGVGFTGRFSTNAVSVKPGQTTQVRMPFSFSSMRVAWAKAINPRLEA